MKEKKKEEKSRFFNRKNNKVKFENFLFKKEISILNQFKRIKKGGILIDQSSNL